MNTTPIFKKVALLLVVVFSTIVNANAQNDNLCTFKQATGTYTPLGDETDITSTVFLPDSYYVLTTPIGVYPLLGQQWDIDYNNRTISIFKNGRIYLGLDTGFAIFDCLYSDSIDLIDASSKVSYWVEGAGNNQILKVQWKNLKVGTGPSGNYFNVQMWFYKATGIIEYRYGDRSANNASGYTTPGPTGIYIGMWYSNYTFTSMYEKIQVKGLPPNIQIDSVLNTNVPNIHGIPENGTVYRFIPKAVAASLPGLANTGNNIRISPNPAHDKVNVTIDLPGAEELSISLINTLGAVVYQSTQSFGKGSHSIDISTADLANGNYYLRVSGKGVEQVQQLSIIK